MKARDLKPNPKNPRVITDAKLSALKKAMLEFGDLSGIVFNRRTGQLVGGHQRGKNFDESTEVRLTKRYPRPTRTGTVAVGYLRHRGERFSYREVDWDKHREMAANIAANKGAGEFDREALGDWLKELNSFDVDYDLGLTMFDNEELLDFGLSGITVAEHTRSGPTGVDEDDVPEKPPARTKPGQVFALGNHRLMCGDSTVGDAVEVLMEGERADLIFTDPPYGVSYAAWTPAEAKRLNHRRDGQKVSNDSLSGEQLRAFLNTFLTVSPLKPGGAFYLCSPAGSTETDFRLSLGSEFPLRQALVWVKQQFVFGRQDYHWRHETILYGWREGAAHYFLEDRTQDTVWEFDRPHRSPEHPTMKPVELVEKGVFNSSRDGEVVYDAFGGSGTTLIACEKLGRRCRMMEVDPSYCDVIIERWEKYTGKKARLLNGRPAKADKRKVDRTSQVSA